MKRVRKWLIIMTLMALAILLAPQLAVPMLRSRIQAMVAQQLNAELKMDSLSYQFPYGIRVKGASIVSRGPDGAEVELFHIDRLDLSLAELPFGQGPLVIQKLVLKNPSLHLIQTPTGMIGERGLVRNAPATSRSDELVKAMEQGRLSDMFQLRRFAIENGQIIYEDHTRPASVPMVWRNLDIDLKTTPQTGAVYAYDLTAQSPPATKFAAAGTMDIDQLVLDLRQMALDVQVDKDAQQSQLPAPLQEFLRQNQVAGAMHIAGTAQVPFHNPASAKYSATFELPRASANVPSWDAQLDHLVVKLRCSNAPSTQATTFAARVPVTGPGDTPPVYVYLDQFEAGSGDTILKVDPGASVQFDSSQSRWAVHDLSGALDIGVDHSPLPTNVENLFNKLNLHGHLDLCARASGPTDPVSGVRAVDQIEYEAYAYPRRLSFQPKGFPQPLKMSNLGGSSIHLLPGSISLANFEARYGDDHVIVSSANIPLGVADELIHINGLNAAIIFSSDSPDYPEEIDPIIKALHPGGTFHLYGDCTLDPHAHPMLDYTFQVAAGQPAVLSDASQPTTQAATFPATTALISATITSEPAESASLSPTSKRLLLNNVQLAALLTRRLIDVTHFQARSYGGLVEATAQIHPGKVDTYQASGKVSDVDMAAFAKAYAEKSAEPVKLTGKGSGIFDAIGTEPTEGRTLADNFSAKGQFEVLDGDFWELPIVRRLLDRVSVARTALTAGQAAGDYDIHNQKILIDDAAVGSSVIGLQGAGEVDFDGKTDLSVVVAPLADWRAKLDETGVPWVSRAVGEVAGRLQDVLNSATSKLLYQFHVTGTVENPEINAVPAPVVTRPLAELFGHMMKSETGERLLETIHRIHPPRPATTEPE